jgi:hypothetical protein
MWGEEREARREGGTQTGRERANEIITCVAVIDASERTT